MYISAPVIAGTGALTAQVTLLSLRGNSTRNVTWIATFDRRLHDFANRALADCCTDRAIYWSVKQQILSRVCGCIRTVYIQVSSHSQPISADNSDAITQSHNTTLHTDWQLISHTCTRPSIAVTIVSTHPQVCEQFYNNLYLTSISECSFRVSNLNIA